MTVEMYHPKRRYLEFYLSRELSILGHDVNLISFTDNRCIKVKRDHSGFILHRVPYWGSIQGYRIPSLSAIRYIFSYLKDEVPDIIHCQPLFSPLSIAVSLKGRQLGSKIVGSLISGIYVIDNTQSYVNYIISKLMTDWYLNRVVSFFFAKSRGLKKILRTLYNLDPSRIQVIPLGADHNFFVYNEKSRIRIREKLNLKDTDLLIIWSGKLNELKQVEVLLDAVAPTINLNQNVKLLILGEGNNEYSDYLRNTCERYGISDNVIFHSLVDFEDLPAFFSAGDFAVWPAGASISMLEAASCGLPLISMRSPIEEYVITPENALVFEQGNTSELHNHLEELVNNAKLREEMGRNSRMLVEKALNWRAIANRYVETYESTRCHE